MKPGVSRRRVMAARAIAIAADLVQIGLLPIVGGFSPVDDVLDLAVAGLLTWLVGFHVAFLPTLLVELVPFVDTFPTWTLAVLFVTRGEGRGDGRIEPPAKT